MKQAERRKKYRLNVARLTGERRSSVPGRKYGYTLDHLVSVQFGFNHDIPEELIASAENLQWLPFNENLEKSYRMTPEAIALLRRWGYNDLADVYEERISR